jgi:hypothetical protein
METAPSPKTWATIYWMTQCFFPEDFNLYQHRGENMKYGINVKVSKPYNRP